jgi:hypothetical protein
MARGKRTQREYQSALDSAIFGRYEAEVFTDVWNEVVDLRAEVEQLRAVEAAALALRARVRDWGAVPFLGPGHEEAYELATNAAEDAILVAADAFDAAAGSNGEKRR